MSAGAALVLAGAVVAAPIVPRLPEIPVVSSAVSLVVDGSPLNIPINLLIDLISVPFNEINGMQMFANSGFFTGSWLVPSATNLWGTDPGDIGHYYSLANMLVPFPVLANGIAAQVAGYAEAELPASAWCDAEGCLPTLPAVPITGITPIDQGIWGVLTGAGLAPFPLKDAWQQVPLSTLMSGYTFDQVWDPHANNDTGGFETGTVVDPSGPVYANPAFPGDAFQPTGPDDAMPWAGTTFTLDPTKPFTDFLTSLMADPASNLPQLLNPLTPIQTLQSLLAALVIDFDPLTPGTALCPGHCVLPEPLTIPGIVGLIGTFPPGNPQIDAWLAGWNDDGTHDDTINWATQEQIAIQYDLFNQPFTDDGPGHPTWPSPFGTGPMPDSPATVDAVSPASAASDPDKLLSDLVALVTMNNSDLGQLLAAGGLSGLFSTASTDFSALWADLVGTL